MSLFLTLLPIYIFGNLHCMGMCGPLVLMLGMHRYRHFYFLGRTLSFTLAGSFAGAFGSVFQVFLHQFHISALVSFLFGGVILIAGILILFRMRLPFFANPPSFFKKINQKISSLILKDGPFSVFLFGFFTIALPCGQTVIVYSALALEGGFWFGTLNGLLFALLTSPSLLLAMNAQTLLKNFKPYYNLILGLASLIIGSLGLCRGFAEMGLIPHLVLNPYADPEFHIALY